MDAAAERVRSNSTLCGHCSKALQKPLVCARCKTATYCSKDCQVHTAHATRHTQTRMRLNECVYVTVRRTHVHMRTRARTHIHTHRHKHTQMPHRRSPSLPNPHPFPLLLPKAWKAGHKGECKAAARADTRTAAKPTADQMRVLEMLEQLAGAADWRGVAVQEGAARAVAAAVRTFHAGLCFVCLLHPRQRV